MDAPGRRLVPSQASSDDDSPSPVPQNDARAARVEPVSVNRPYRNHGFTAPTSSSIESFRRSPSERERLRELKYVDQVHEELFCPICTCPLIEPVGLPACGHVFCSDCILATWDMRLSNSATQRRCPSCRADHDGPLDTRLPRILVNMLNDLRVECAYRELGCTDTMSRQDLDFHLQHECVSVSTPCPMLDCDQHTTRKNAQANIPCDACAQKLRQCSRCEQPLSDDEKAIAEDAAEDAGPGKHDDSARTTLCRSCKATSPDFANVPRSEREMGTRCKAHSVGCRSRGTQEELETHQSTCMFVTILPAFDSVNQLVQEQSETIRSLRRRNGRLEERLEQLTLEVKSLRQPTSAVSARAEAQMSERLQMELLECQESVRADVWGEMEQLREQMSERMTDMLRYHQENLRNDLQGTVQACHWLRADVDNLARVMRHQGRFPPGLSPPGAPGLAMAVGIGASPPTAPGPSGQIPIRRMSDGSSRSVDTKL